MSTAAPHPPRLSPARFLTIPPATQSQPYPPSDGAAPVPSGRILHHLPALIRLAELRQMVFPDAPGLDQIVRVAATEDVIKLVEGFLTRVNEELFPVQHDIWDWDPDADSFLYWYLGAVPIALQGISSGYSHPSEFQEPMCLVLYLADLEWYGLEARASFTSAYPEWEVPPDLKIGSLRDQLRAMELPEPLNALPDLISMALQDTGVFWLDYCQEEYAESGMEHAWSPANVRDFHEEWCKARPIYDRVWALIAWTDANPAPRTRELLNTILRAHIREFFSDEYNVRETP